MASIAAPSVLVSPPIHRLLHGDGIEASERRAKHVHLADLAKWIDARAEEATGE